MAEQDQQPPQQEPNQGVQGPRLRPRQSISGFFDSEPSMRVGESGIARTYARVGIEHFRRLDDGGFAKTGTTFHDMAIFRATAEEVNERFEVGDNFVAQGYVREYTDNQGAEREEFVTTKIGHDAVRTPYTVDREPPQAEMAREAPGLDRSQAFERDQRPVQQHEPTVMSH